MRFDSRIVEGAAGGRKGGYKRRRQLSRRGSACRDSSLLTPLPVAQIDVAVNAPKAGLITELLAAEEDTVAVGQDLFKLDPEGKSEGGGAFPFPPLLFTPSLPEKRA